MGDIQSTLGHYPSVSWLIISQKVLKNEGEITPEIMKECISAEKIKYELLEKKFALERGEEIGGFKCDPTAFPKVSEFARKYLEDPPPEDIIGDIERFMTPQNVPLLNITVHELFVQYGIVQLEMAEELVDGLGNEEFYENVKKRWLARPDSKRSQIHFRFIAMEKAHKKVPLTPEALYYFDW